METLTPLHVAPRVRDFVESPSASVPEVSNSRYNDFTLYVGFVSVYSVIRLITGSIFGGREKFIREMQFVLVGKFWG